MPLRFEPIETAKLTWGEDGQLPTSETYGDVYFSRSGAIEESQLVFIEGNQLSERFAQNETTVVGELGFGFGINFLATLKRYKEVRRGQSRGRLIFISTEKHPVLQNELARVYEHIPELKEESSALLAKYPHLFSGFHSMVFDEWNAELWLLLGDAEQSLVELEAKVDAWYLDGFTPKENPALWSESLMKELARLSKPGETTVATYSVAGEVRRTLEKVGFEVEKKKGFAHKRERLEGRFVKSAPQTSHRARFDLGFRFRDASESVHSHRVAVVGAGMAGVACAQALSQAGFCVELIDARKTWAEGCSALPRALYKPHVTGGASPVSLLTLRAFDFLTRRLPLNSGGVFKPEGVLKIEKTKESYEKINRLLREHILPESLIAASESHEGFVYPTAGSLDPVRTLTKWIESVKERIQFRLDCEIVRIERAESSVWRLLDTEGKGVAEVHSVVLAAGEKMATLIHSSDLEFRYVRGQLEVVKPKRVDGRALLSKQVLQDESHLTPLDEKGLSTIGSTYDPLNRSLEPRIGDTERLLEAARTLSGVEYESVRSYVGIRTTTVDRLPLIGPISLELPGVYTFSALASRGMTFSAWGAHLIAHYIRGAALPLERSLIEAVHPLRFKYRYER